MRYIRSGASTDEDPEPPPQHLRDAEAEVEPGDAGRVVRRVEHALLVIETREATRQLEQVGRDRRHGELPVSPRATRERELEELERQVSLLAGRKQRVVDPLRPDRRVDSGRRVLGGDQIALAITPRSSPLRTIPQIRAWLYWIAGPVSPSNESLSSGSKTMFLSLPTCSR